VEDGLEAFAALALAGRGGDVAYYAGWDWFNYWSNFLPGFSAARHAWAQKGCAGRDRRDGVGGDGWGSPLLAWVQGAFSSFFPMDAKAYSDNPAFPYSGGGGGGGVGPDRVDSVRAGGAVNRSIVCFNDALRGDLRPWEAPGGLAGDRVLQWSLAWDAGNSTAPPLLAGEVPFSAPPGFHALAHVAFVAPSPGGSGAPRKLFIRLRSVPQADKGAQGELVGVEDKVYILVVP